MHSGLDRLDITLYHKFICTHRIQATIYKHTYIYIFL